MDDEIIKYENSEEDLALRLRIYRCICRHYPIGVGIETMVYRNNPSFLLLQKLIQQKRKIDNPVYLRWLGFEKNLAQVFPDKDITKQNITHTPSYSIQITLEKNTINQIEHVKKLFIFKSIIFPCYSMFGVDQVSIIETSKERDTKRSKFKDKFTFEPIYEFSDHFEKVKKLAKSSFENNDFIPVKKLLFHVKGLELPYYRHPNFGATFFQALFDASSFRISPLSTQTPFLDIWENRRK